MHNYSQKYRFVGMSADKKWTTHDLHQPNKEVDRDFKKYPQIFPDVTVYSLNKIIGIYQPLCRNIAEWCGHRTTTWSRWEIWRRMHWWSIDAWTATVQLFNRVVVLNCCLIITACTWPGQWCRRRCILQSDIYHHRPVGVYIADHTNRRYTLKIDHLRCTVTSVR
jgi:hypothetical protein